MTAILVLGDVHLGKGISLAKQSVGNIFNSRINDQVDLLDWTLTQAIDGNIRHLVLTGDVFEDPKPHHSLVVAFIDWLNKCSQENINVHVIAGNHDILRSGSYTTSPLDIVSSAAIPNVFVYNRISTLHEDGFGITFMPFKDRRSFNTDINAEAVNKLASQVPYELLSIDNNSKKILVGHLALEGSIPIGYELDDLANELMCPLSMFNGYDYVLMGHVHKFQVVSEQPHIAHIGSMDISDFGESEHEKFIAVLDSKNGFKPEYIKIPTRGMKHLSIQLPEEEKDATSYIKNELSKIDNLKKSIVKLSISLPKNSSQTIDRNLIEKMIYDIGAFHVTKITEERSFETIKQKNIENMDNDINESSAIKKYAQSIDENMRESFVKAATDIINEFKGSIK